MRKNSLIILSILGVTAILYAALNASNNKVFSPSTSPIPSPTTSEQISTPTSLSSNNIEVITPHSEDVVKSGFTVRGNARVFENVVSIRLRDSEGNILTQTTTYAQSPDVGLFGPFEKQINYATRDITGVLEVYQASPKDGSDIDKVTIPLVLNSY